MAADSLLCPTEAKPDLTGQEGLQGEMDMAEDSRHPSSKDGSLGHSAG